jgi:hypothetical protein
MRISWSPSVFKSRHLAFPVKQKGVRMKLQLIIGSIILSSFCYACMGPDDAPPTYAADGRSSASKANLPCRHTVQKDADGKAIKGSVKIVGPGNGCTEHESQGQLYVTDNPTKGDHRVLSMPAAGEFITEGSCRYCYLNSAGGASCIGYPPPC